MEHILSMSLNFLNLVSTIANECWEGFVNQLLDAYPCNLKSCLFYIYVDSSNFRSQFAIFRKDLLWTKMPSVFFQFVLNDCLKMGLLVS
jgi:hypothetical protein